MVSPREDLTEHQKKILGLTLQRLVEGEDLAFNEILIALYGCRPVRVGPLWVRNFSQNELLDLCRSGSYLDLHFENDDEQDRYMQNKACASKAVSALTDMGLIVKIRMPRLVWEKDQPRVKRLEYYDTIRLTKKGEEILAQNLCQYAHPVTKPEILPSRQET